MEVKMERKGLLQFMGQDAVVVGPDIQVGQKAPEFMAVGSDWKPVAALASTQGKVRIIGSLLSASTSVCDHETRLFNQEATNLSDDIAILMVSTDLPFTLKNWCASAGIDKVATLSDNIQLDFGEKYGVLLKDFRVFRRAIFVVDRKGTVVYAEYTPALGEEPNYPEVLNAARKALG
jgi:thioredoxin-dependent peroxiredoxin